MVVWREKIWTITRVWKTNWLHRLGPRFISPPPTKVVGDQPASQVTTLSVFALSPHLGSKFSPSVTQTHPGNFSYFIHHTYSFFVNSRSRFILVFWISLTSFIDILREISYCAMREFFSSRFCRLARLRRSRVSSSRLSRFRASSRFAFAIALESSSWFSAATVFARRFP